jgi:hypothetical protein
MIDDDDEVQIDDRRGAIDIAETHGNRLLLLLLSKNGTTSSSSSSRSRDEGMFGTLLGLVLGLLLGLGLLEDMKLRLYISCNVMYAFGY